MDISSRLKGARTYCGLTLAEVSGRTGIDDSSLSAYENGRTTPRLGQLEQLANVYRVAISYFFDEGAEIEQGVLWRNKPENEKEVQAEFLQLCRQYRQLELWAEEDDSACLPNLDDFGEKFGYEEAKQLAKWTRKIMGLGDRPGESLYTILEEVYGVKIFHLDLGQSGAAASAVSNMFGKAILLNVRSRRWRRNHDLAHELFHLLTWEKFGHGGGVCEPKAMEDKLATCFAGNLLLPYDIVTGEISKKRDKEGNVSLSKLDCIARQFDVSLESLLWRMHFIYKWKEKDTNRYVNEAKEYIAKTQRNDESVSLKYPERYRALAIRVFQNGGISLGRFAKLLDITRKEAEKFTDRDGDHEIPTSAA